MCLLSFNWQSFTFSPVPDFIKKTAQWHCTKKVLFLIQGFQSLYVKTWPKVRVATAHLCFGDTSKETIPRSLNIDHSLQKCKGKIYVIMREQNTRSVINYTGQQNLTFFLSNEEKYLILIERLTLNSNM
jgi:hypothetical protein